MGTRTGWRRAGWAGLGTAALVASSVLVGPGPVGAVAVGVTVLTDLPVKVLAPVGISDAGTSAFSMLDMDTHLSTAVLWDGATTTTVTPTGASSSPVVGINAAGTIVGTAYFGGVANGHAWVRTPDGAIAVEAVGGGVTSVGTAINGSGQALVLLTDSGVAEPAVWTPPAAPTPIMTADPLVAEYRPVLMNDAGQVVSVNDGAPGGPTTIFWDPATPAVTTTIAPVAGATLTVSALGDDGTILFRSTDGTTARTYLWTDGVTTEIDDPTRPDPTANAMNPVTGQVVGTIGDVGFSWTRTGGFVDLTCSPADMPVVVSSVNRSGYVSGSCGIDDGAKDQSYEPVVWSPTGARTSLGVPSAYTTGDATLIDDHGRVAGMYGQPVEGKDTVPFLARVAYTPSAPRELTGTAGVASAALSWSPPTDDGFATPTYRIYADGVQVGATTGDTTLLLSDLPAGVAVSYQVTAVNAGGESIRSAAAVVTPLVAPAVPIAPVVPSAATPVAAQPAFTG